MFLDDIVSPLSIEEAKSRRMSAQLKLARAFDREQQKSTASRERAKQLMNPGVDRNKEPEPSGTYKKNEFNIGEEWSQKYKKSINCSHPKGFSQKAHCAGKKKHNEDVAMEMVCSECGMCEAHGNLNEIAKGQKDSNGVTKCWSGYHAAGTKKGKNGGQVRNCVPNEGVAEGDREFRNQERNAGLEPEDNGTYSIWTQGAKDDKPKSIITKQCSMDDAERHARSIKKKYPFLKVWMQAHHLGKSGFFPMNEDSWSDGQGQWSSEHDQWTKESVEPTDTSEAVYGAIIRRIIGGHASLLGKYGPERVMAAAQDVAEWNSDVEEIGTSDVSGWVRQVFQKLQNNEY